MIALVAIMLQVASPMAAEAQSTTEITESVVGTAGRKVVSQLPTGRNWLAMTPESRRLHAVVSVEALRINPNFRKCAGLTPMAFEARMGANSAADAGSTTITITALSVYDLCPPKG